MFGNDRAKSRLGGFRLRYSPVLFIVFTCIISAMLIYEIYDSREQGIELAKTSARTYYDLNLAYRKMVSNIGGVYAPVEKVAPNPYLKVPNREVHLSNGKTLTLINPAYMSRLAFDMVQTINKYPIKNRIVSLKYLNPDNAPNEWERQVLLSFERGEKEASRTVDINGEPFLVLMKPFITEEGCLKCHGHQGYKIGDVRGGLSIYIPLKQYYAIERKETIREILFYLCIWGVGIVGVLLFSRIDYKKNQRIIESEWKFRTIAETTNDWEFWLTPEGKFMFMSNAGAEITGYSPGEFAADPGLLQRIVHPDERELFVSHYRDMHAPRHKDIEFRITTKDGTVKWISHTCAPMYKDGVFIGRHSNNLDITERKRIEEQLRQAQKMESIGILAGGVAHDFNNILTAILGYGHLALMKMPKDDPNRLNVEHILEAADRAAHLTQDLLLFSRKHSIERKPVDLNDIVQKLEKFISRLIGEDIKCNTKLYNENLNILADRNQIQQVLMNLITNARDAMPKGGIIDIRIEPVTLDEEFVSYHGYGKAGRYALLSVSDTGAGMDDEVRKRIFEPFFTTKMVGKGTGLGLAVVYGIVKQHEGYINVYSELGLGTTFRIYFPLVDIKADDGEHVIEEPAHGSETILLAEDDAAVRSLTEAMLREFGYTVITASDGEDAIKKYIQNKDIIDLLIFDLIMPGKNGKEAYDEIKKLSPNIKVIFSSGYSADILRDKASLGEDAEVVYKPVAPSEFLLKVRKVLDSRQKP